jgi:hypothetical protein
MTNDLVKQLRGGYVVDYDEENQVALCKEAAERIKALEAALKRIAAHDMQAIAMDALRPGERIKEKKNV